MSIHFFCFSVFVFFAFTSDVFLCSHFLSSPSTGDISQDTQKREGGKKMKASLDPLEWGVRVVCVSLCGHNKRITQMWVRITQNTVRVVIRGTLSPCDFSYCEMVLHNFLGFRECERIHSVPSELFEMFSWRVIRWVRWCENDASWHEGRVCFLEESFEVNK